MKTKYTVSAIALATMGVAAPAMAQETVNIDVQVQNVAFLETTDSSGSMTIDNDEDTFMGNPSSGGSLFDTATTDLAVIKLSTNYAVGVDLDFPRIQGGNANGRVRNFTNATFFGEAPCITACGDSTVIGVWPHIGGLTAENGSIVGGGGGILSHDGSDSSLELFGPTRQDTGGFENGEHFLGLGVATNWDRTVNGEPQFASPGTYGITLTATILPVGL